MTHTFMAYLAGCLLAWLLAVGSMVLRRDTEELSRGDYWLWLFRGWKLITFAVATIGVAVMAPHTGDASWDAGFMSILVWATVRWGEGSCYLALLRRRPFVHAPILRLKTLSSSNTCDPSPGNAVMKKISIALPCLIAWTSLCCIATGASATPRPQIYAQMGHTGAVNAVAFSPDGRYALSGSKDDTVKLWDVASGRQIRTFSGCRDQVDAIAVTPDGRYVIAGNEDPYRNILIWDITTGKEVRHFGQDAWSIKMAISPDGRYLVSSNVNNALDLWDIRTGRRIKTFKGHSSAITAVVITPDGRDIISGSQDETLRMWDIATGRQVRTFRGHTDSIDAAAVTPDGKALLSTSEDGTLRIWDIASGRPIKVYHPGRIWSIAISPDGQYALLGKCYAITLWDIKAGKALKTVRMGGVTGGWLESVAFSPDGKYALSAGNGNNMRLWDIASFTGVKSFGGDTRQVVAAAIGPNGKLLVSAQAKNCINLWDIAGGRQIAVYKPPLALNSTAISRNGKFVAAGGWDPAKKAAALDLWDIDTGKSVGAFRHKGVYGAESVAIGPAGKRVLWADGQILRLSDTTTGKEIRTFGKYQEIMKYIELRYAGLSADGRYAVSSNGRTIHIWDTATGKKIQTFGETPDHSILGETSDGRHLIFMDESVKLTVWDLAKNKAIHTVQLHPRNGQMMNTQGLLAVSHDIRYALTIGDRSLELWDLATGRDVRTFRGPTGKISAIGISPNDAYVYASSEDGTVRLWALSTGREVARFIAFADGEWVVITPQGYFNASRNGAKRLNVRIGNKVYALDQLYNRFYRPDLVRLALSGKRLPGGATFTDILVKHPAPTVRIVSPAPGSAIDRASATVSLEITDNGGGIGTVDVYVNGSQVANDTRAIRVVGKETPKIKRLSFTVPLVTGQNEIRVVAFNRRGSMESAPAVISVVSRAVLEKPDLYALVVGINRYRNHSISLTYAVADAQAFAATLKAVTAPLFGKTDIRVLTRPRETTKSAITNAFEGLREKIKPNDLFVFYDASHGTIDRIHHETAAYFLITSNVLFLSSRHIARDALGQAELARLIGSIPAQKKLVILDTCNAGMAGKGIQIALLKDTRGLTAATAVKLLQRAIGSAVFAASSDTQQALEGYRGHGLFTYALLEGLRGKADYKKDGYITVLGLADYVEDRVVVLSEKLFNRQQTPTIETGTNFPIGKVNDKWMPATETRPPDF